MNILPLVTAFLLLFALGAYTLLHQSIATRQEERHLEGAQRLHWRKVSQADRALYKALPAKPTNTKTEKKPSAPKPSPYISPRKKFNLPECAKLNISPLFNQEKQNPLLRKAAIALINRLYSPTLAYRQGIEEEILEVLIKTGMENPKIESFEELFAKIEPNPAPYYKFIKGTQKYQLYTNIGYPALEDFFTLEGKRAPILMSHACEPLLIALFGDAFANHLIQKETEIWQKEGKHIPLKKEEIAALFLEHSPNNKNLSDFESILDYKPQDRHLEQLVIYDEKSKILLRFR